jgi:aconitate hydratase
MGILPLQFRDGQSAQGLGLTGFETFDILCGPGDALQPKQVITVRAVDAAGGSIDFKVVCRIDTPVEVEYYRNGGILQTVLRQMIKV